MKNFWVGFLIGIVFSIIALFVFGYFWGEKMLRNNSLLEPRLKTTDKGKVVNFNFKLRSLHTDSLIDDNFFKEKVVLLNFWEYWCVPCKRELPSIAKLYSSVKDSLVIFAIISTESPDSTKKDEAIKKYPLPFYSMDGIVPDLFRSEIVPRTYIINKKGELVVSEIGAVQWDNERVLGFIDSLKKIVN